jgi:hypothetical protein
LSLQTIPVLHHFPARASAKVGMERSYLIRYGTASQIGRFSADPETVLERGKLVVIQSHRGVELGEVLIESRDEASDQVVSSSFTRVLRPASPDDVAEARRIEAEKDVRFAQCVHVLNGGEWPIDLIDVEPLLEGKRTVLHYLGSRIPDLTQLLAAFRSACDLDVMFQPVGLEEPIEDEHDDDHGCGSCSASGGCGSASGGCGTSSGCGDCGVKKLLAARH